MSRFLTKQIINKYKPAIGAIFLGEHELDPSPSILNALSEKFIVSANSIYVKTEEDAALGVLGAGAGQSFLSKLLAAFPLLSGGKKNFPEVILYVMNDARALEKIAGFSGFMKFDFVIDVPGKKSKSFINEENIGRFLKKNTRLIVKFFQKGIVDPSVKKRCKVLTYSSPQADIFASDLLLQSNGGLKSAAKCGISFKINYKGSLLPVRVSRSINEKEVCNVLIATLFGIEMGMNLVEVASSFDNYQPTGEKKVVDGIKHSVIVDDSNNYALETALETIDNFGKLKAARKIIVVGDTLGLGLSSEEKHREIARRIFSVAPDLVFCVGARSLFILDELRKLNYKNERVFKFNTGGEVEKILQPKIIEGDLVLVMGSKEMGLGNVVRQITANPPLK